METEKYTVEKFEDGEQKGYQLSINDNKEGAYKCWIVPNSDGSYSAKSKYSFTGIYDLGTYDTFDIADKHIKENILELASDHVNATNSADDWFQKPVDLGAGPISTTNEDMLFILGFGRKERSRASLSDLIDA
jgi:hypothetical protein